MADLYNPNNIPHGSRILTINSFAYKADHYPLPKPTKQLGREEVTGEDSEDLFVVGARATGSATLQLATGSTAHPTLGMTFDSPDGALSRKYVLTEIGKPESSGAIKVLNISFADVGAGA